MPHRSKRILIVDDNTINRMLLRHIVEQDYFVDEATNGREALKLISESKKAYSAVLLDIVMPVMDGFAFLRRLRQDPSASSLPVVVVTEANDRDTELRALTLGANDFMKKPYEPLIIRRRLENIIRLKEYTDLEKRRAQDRELIDQLPCCVAIYVFSDQVQLRYMSEGIQSISGYDHEEYLEKYAQDVLQAVQPDCREKVRNSLLSFASLKLPIDIEYRSLCKDGTERWTQLRGQYAGEDNQGIVYYCVLTDSTAAKRAQDQLLTSESQLRLAFKQSALDLISFDFNTNILKYTEHPGPDEKVHQFELTGSELRAMIHPDSLPVFDAALKQLFDGKSPISAELFVRRRARYRWFSYSLSVIGEADSRRMIGVCRDITSEVEARRAYELEAGYRRALTEDALAFWECDLEASQLLTYDDALLSMLGLSADCSLLEFAEAVLDRFVHPDDRHLFDSILQYIRTPSLYTNHASTELVVECRTSQPKFTAYRWASVLFSFILNPSTGRQHMFACVRDIHERKTDQLRMMEKAQRDPLTGLYNRSAFIELLSAALTERENAKDSKELAAFLIVDIDDFKQVNDTRGHAYGDEVLVQLGIHLRELFRKTDIIGRLGGDEFAVFLPHIPNEELVLSKGLSICRLLLESAGNLTLSVGAAIVPWHGTTFEELYANADAALYRAKQNGKSSCCIFDGKTASPDTLIQSSPEPLCESFDEFIHVTDLESYSLLYCNQAVRQRFQLPDDYVGTTCYKSLFNLDKPCPWCDNTALSFDNFAVQKQDIPALNSTLIFRDRLVLWQGRAARLELVIDANNSSTLSALLKAPLENRVLNVDTMSFVMDHIDAAVFNYETSKDELNYVLLGSPGTAFEHKLPNFVKKLNHSPTLHADDVHRLAACFEDNPDTPEELRLRFRSLDVSQGKMALYQLTCRRYRADNGQLENVIGIIQRCHSTDGAQLDLEGPSSSFDSTAQASWPAAEQIASLIHGLPVGIALIDTSHPGRLLYHNDMLCTLIGHSSEMLTSDSLQDLTSLIHPQDKTPVCQHIARSSASGEKIDHTFRIILPAGGYRWVRMIAEKASSLPLYVAAFTEMQDFQPKFLELQQEYSKLREKSVFDPLTGLLCSEAFYNKGASYLAAHPNRQHTLVVFCLDRLGAIFKLFDHRDADDVLRSVSKQISSWVGSEGGLCALLEYNLFAVLLPSQKYSDNRLDTLLGGTIELNGTQHNLPYRAGVVHIPLRNIEKTSVAELCEHAILALFSARGTANQIAYYYPALETERKREQEIMAGMGKAFDEQQFALYVQPIFGAEKADIVGAEALARWEHPENGLIYPARFLPIMEENLNVGRLDFLMLKQVCVHLQNIMTEKGTGLPFSLNLSRHDFNDPDLVHRFIAMSKKHNIPHKLLQIELDAGKCEAGQEQIFETIRAFRRHGFPVTLDNMGGSHSALSALVSLPVDAVKIDIQLVRASENSQRALRICENICALCKSLGCKVIAKGVETERQYQLMRSIGCDFIQGFYFSKPVSIREFAEQLLS